jgi:hypothetical protein
MSGRGFYCLGREAEAGLGKRGCRGSKAHQKSWVPMLALRLTGSVMSRGPNSSLGFHFRFHLKRRGFDLGAPSPGFSPDHPGPSFSDKLAYRTNILCPNALPREIHFFLSFRLFHPLSYQWVSSHMLQCSSDGWAFS